MTLFERCVILKEGGLCYGLAIVSPSRVHGWKLGPQCNNVEVTASSGRFLGHWGHCC